MPAENAYLSNTAVNEYQAKLAAQQAADRLATQHTPDDMVAVYNLKERVPNVTMLLNMGAGRGGLSVYSTVDLHYAFAALYMNVDEWYKQGDYHFSLAEQRERVSAELNKREA